MATAEFRGALAALLAAAVAMRTTVMCSEAVPGRCHRTMIADAAVARGARVLHVLDAGTSPHRLTSFARLENGDVRYDSATPVQGTLFPSGDAVE
jgi:uncharacterized protein (DUF488 family)